MKSLTERLKLLAPNLRLYKQARRLNVKVQAAIKNRQFKFSHKQLVLVTAPVSTGASLL